ASSWPGAPAFAFGTKGFWVPGAPARLVQRDVWVPHPSRFVRRVGKVAPDLRLSFANLVFHVEINLGGSAVLGDFLSVELHLNLAVRRTKQQFAPFFPCATFALVGPGL